MNWLICLFAVKAREDLVVLVSDVKNIGRKRRPYMTTQENGELKIRRKCFEVMGREYIE